MKSSLPSPPVRVSAPALPVMSSSPASPSILSAPVPPTKTSLAAPPLIMSSPAPPVIWSIPAEPVSVKSSASFSLDALMTFVCPPSPSLERSTVLIPLLWALALRTMSMTASVFPATVMLSTVAMLLAQLSPTTILNALPPLLLIWIESVPAPPVISSMIAFELLNKRVLLKLFV